MRMKCPFSVIQAAGIARCSRAREVVRRGGSEFDCTDTAALERCSALQRRLLDVGLETLGHVDDLNTTPKSVYDRVLVGGLRGIGEATPDATAASYETDIWSLVEAALGMFPDLAHLPPEPIADGVRTTQLQRRRGSRKHRE